MTNSMSCIRASLLVSRLLIRTPICTAPVAGSAKNGVTRSSDSGSSRPSASTTTTMTRSGSRPSRCPLPSRYRTAALSASPLPCRASGGRRRSSQTRSLPTPDTTSAVPSSDPSSTTSTTKLPPGMDSSRRRLFTMTFSSFRQGIMNTKNKSPGTPAATRRRGARREASSMPSP